MVAAVSARTRGPWSCPAWCSGDHDAGRHSRLVDVTTLTANPAAGAELLAVAIIERLGSPAPRVEIIRDAGADVGLSVLGLSIGEAARVHRMLGDAIELVGGVPDVEPVAEHEGSRIRVYGMPAPPNATGW